MVLWAASFHPGPIAALAPFPDLVRAAQDPVWSGPVSRLLAGDQPSPELYSPQHRSPPLGPAVVAAAREDSVSPPDAVSAYAEAFSTVDFVLCEGSHGSFLEPSSSAWGLVVDWLQDAKSNPLAVCRRKGGGIPFSTGRSHEFPQVFAHGWVVSGDPAHNCGFRRF